MTSTHPSSDRLGDDDPERSGAWLAVLAAAFEVVGGDADWPPTLLGVLEPGVTGHPRLFEVHALDEDDPVPSLVGIDAPPRVRAVCFLAPGTARSLDDEAASARSSLVHIVDRSGTSVTRTIDTDGRPLTIGPTDAVQLGRVADACRRSLGLATAPPPPDTTALVVDAWLDRIVRAAGHRPDLTWPDVVALHPSQTEPCTPAHLALRTVELGDELTWSTVRHAHVDGRVRSDAGIDPAAAAWMDDGMFARWLLGASPPWSSMLEVVDAMLLPGVSDLVAATVGMCPASEWPDP